MEENLILICLTTIVAITWSILERRQTVKLRKILLNSKKLMYKKEIDKTYINLKNRKWYYRGEGNSYLSISLPETRQILRIKKIPHPNGIRENFYSFLYKYSRYGYMIENRAKIEEKLNLDYYHLFVKLLGECYVQPAQEVFLNRDEIWKIDKIIEPLRPKNRIKKHIAYSCGSLLADYAYFPISWDLDNFEPAFSIEIKPKQGWIAKTERTFPMCTYCLNQYIKLKNNEVTEISNYCPLDLFSGNIARMKSAISSLLEAPQNNLKIFKNGKLLYGDKFNKTIKDQTMMNIFEALPNQFDKTEEFYNIVIKALLTNLIPQNQCPNNTYASAEIHNTSWKNITTKVCRFENKLNFGCVLERILNLQKLDQWGSESVLQLITSNNITDDCINFNSGPFCQIDKTTTTESIVNRYLMSAVAKDCSLMITFKRIVGNIQNIPERYIIVSENGLKYIFQIGVFDLYPKQIKTIKKHANKRKLLLQAYEKLCDN